VSMYKDMVSFGAWDLAILYSSVCEGQKAFTVIVSLSRNNFENGLGPLTKL